MRIPSRRTALDKQRLAFSWRRLSFGGRGRKLDILRPSAVRSGRSLNIDDFGSPSHSSITHNLRWFWREGVFAQASESILAAYLILFLLALGASRAQIGFMSALASLCAAAVLLPGAITVERKGHRKLVVLMGGGGTRVILVPLMLVPLALSGNSAVFFAIALIVVRSAFAHFILPAWTSLTADMVPLSYRGRYFASRNIAMGVAGMITAFLIGHLINRAGTPIGYQMAIGIAFAFGVASTFSWGRIQEPATVTFQRTLNGRSSVPLLQQLRANADFVAFCCVAAVLHISIGFSGPFFSVYIVENLGASASMVGTLVVVSTLAALPGQRLFGILTDRWGPRRVQLITSIGIPLVPVAWALASKPWHLIPIDLVGGFLWSGYGLASFTLLLALTPEDRRSRYTAVYQIAVMLALAGGSALGGIIAVKWGFVSLFVLAGLVRFGATLLFARYVPDPSVDTKRSRSYLNTLRRKLRTI